MNHHYSVLWLKSNSILTDKKRKVKDKKDYGWAQ